MPTELTGQALRRMDLNHRPPLYRSGALPRLSYVARVRAVAGARVELALRTGYEPGAAPLLRVPHWRHRWDSNPQPSPRQGVALAIELRRQVGIKRDRSAVSDLGSATVPPMTRSTCCETMRCQLDRQCPVHPDTSDCPEALISVSESGEHRFQIHDGASSDSALRFCPWCGTRLVGPSNPASQAKWASDAATLAEVGKVWYNANLHVEVSVPAELAQRATEAWEDDESEEIAEFETAVERRQRHYAGALALIGLQISEAEDESASGITLGIDPWLIGAALDAADVAGLIHGPPQST